MTKQQRSPFAHEHRRSYRCCLRALLLGTAALAALLCLLLHPPSAAILVRSLIESARRFDLIADVWDARSWLSTSRLNSDPFKWTSCEGIPDKRYKCGRLIVPLDYINKSDKRTAEIATVLFQVGKKKSKNTIIFNPGGPGGSGTAFSYHYGQYISINKTDSTVDVLGFDPRGVNLSSPSISCFPYDADRDRYALLRTLPLETSSDPAEHLMLADAMNEAVMSACLAKYGDIPRFLSTSFVARDVDAIRAALGEDELWAYMVSYGTLIGQTYAQMFPDRVGRMLLDGVMFAPDTRRLDQCQLDSLDNITDAWVDGFLGECVNAGPDRCALAVPSGNAKKPVTLTSLEKRMMRLLERVKARPNPGFTAETGPGIVTYGRLVDLIQFAMFNPDTWPSLAESLDELDRGNATLALTRLEAGFEYDPSAGGLPSGGRIVRHPRNRHGRYSPLGLGGLGAPRDQPTSDELSFLVICGDAYETTAHPQPLAWWAELQVNMTRRSFIAGNSRFYDMFTCRHFHWDVAEVYHGGLNRSVRNPLLLISETYDPVTPLAGGRRLYNAMGPSNARLIVHDGYGHSSHDKSTCTETLVRDFFVHGRVPALDSRNEGGEVHCKADRRPYSARMV